MILYGYDRAGLELALHAKLILAVRPHPEKDEHCQILFQCGEIELSEPYLEFSTRWARFLKDECGPMPSEQSCARARKMRKEATPKAAEAQKHRKEGFV